MTNKSTKTVTIKKSENGQGNKADLKPTMEDVQKVLDAQIENFQKKSALIRNRNKFLATKDELKEFVAAQGADYNEFMEDSGKKVTFTDNERYSSSNGISVSNNFLVREFAQFMLDKIDLKIAEIERQILS